LKTKKPCSDNRSKAFSFYLQSSQSNSICLPIEYFSNSETIGEQAFANAVSSALVRNSVGGRFYISFLPAGSHDLIFVALNQDGSLQEVLGIRRGVSVLARQDVLTCSQTETPVVEGNCLQLEAP
jgi:hypothetical protein